MTLLFRISQLFILVLLLSPASSFAVGGSEKNQWQKIHDFLSSPSDTLEAFHYAASQATSVLISRDVSPERAQQWHAAVIEAWHLSERTHKNIKELARNPRGQDIVAACCLLKSGGVFLNLAQAVISIEHRVPDQLQPLLRLIMAGVRAFPKTRLVIERSIHGVIPRDGELIQPFFENISAPFLSEPSLGSDFTKFHYEVENAIEVGPCYGGYDLDVVLIPGTVFTVTSACLGDSTQVNLIEKQPQSLVERGCAGATLSQEQLKEPLIKFTAIIDNNLKDNYSKISDIFREQFGMHIVKFGSPSDSLYRGFWIEIEVPYSQAAIHLLNAANQRVVSTDASVSFTLSEEALRQLIEQGVLYEVRMRPSQEKNYALSSKDKVCWKRDIPKHLFRYVQRYELSRIKSTVLKADFSIDFVPKDVETQTLELRWVGRYDTSPDLVGRLSAEAAQKLLAILNSIKHQAVTPQPQVLEQLSSDSVFQYLCHIDRVLCCPKDEKLNIFGVSEHNHVEQYLEGLQETTEEFSTDNLGLQVWLGLNIQELERQITQRYPDVRVSSNNFTGKRPELRVILPTPQDLSQLICSIMLSGPKKSTAEALAFLRKFASNYEINEIIVPQNRTNVKLENRDWHASSFIRSIQNYLNFIFGQYLTNKKYQIFGLFLENGDAKIFVITARDNASFTEYLRLELEKFFQLKQAKFYSTEDIAEKIKTKCADLFKGSELQDILKQPALVFGKKSVDYLDSSIPKNTILFKLLSSNETLAKLQIIIDNKLFAEALNSYDFASSADKAKVDILKSLPPKPYSGTSSLHSNSVFIGFPQFMPDTESDGVVVATIIGAPEVAHKAKQLLTELLKSWATQLQVKPVSIKNTHISYLEDVLELPWLLAKKSGVSFLTSAPTQREMEVRFIENTPSTTAVGPARAEAAGAGIGTIDYYVQTPHKTVSRFLPPKDQQISARLNGNKLITVEAKKFPSVPTDTLLVPVDIDSKSRTSGLFASIQQRTRHGKIDIHELFEKLSGTEPVPIDGGRYICISSRDLEYPEDRKQALKKAFTIASEFDFHSVSIPFLLLGEDTQDRSKQAQVATETVDAIIEWSKEWAGTHGEHEQTPLRTFVLIDARSSVAKHFENALKNKVARDSDLILLSTSDQSAITLTAGMLYDPRFAEVQEVAPPLAKVSCEKKPQESAPMREPQLYLVGFEEAILTARTKIETFLKPTDIEIPSLLGSLIKMRPQKAIGADAASLEGSLRADLEKRFIKQISFPAHWSKTTEDEDTLLDKVDIVELLSQSNEFKVVSNKFKEGFINARILKIERVQNYLQYRRYQSMYFNLAPQFEEKHKSQEQTLFYANERIPPKALVSSHYGICQAFQVGESYSDRLADCSSSISPYFKQTSEEPATGAGDFTGRSVPKQMIMAKVILGKIFEAPSSIMPSSTDEIENAHSIKFKNQGGTRLSYSYSVSNADQVYPEYIITYVMDQ